MLVVDVYFDDCVQDVRLTGFNNKSETYSLSLYDMNEKMAHLGMNIGPWC